MLAEELSEWGEAKSNYLEALTIFARFEDEYGLKLTIRNLAHLYQITQDNGLIIEVTTLLEMTEKRVINSFQQVLIENE